MKIYLNIKSRLRNCIVDKIRYRARKRSAPSADVSLTGAYRWCSHLTNAFESALCCKVPAFPNAVLYS